MTRATRVVAASALAVFCWTGSLLAQDVKLRPMRPIYVDSLGAAMKAPEGVAFDGASRLVVADTGNRRLVLFDVTKETISPSSEIRLSQIPMPVDVALNSAGEILALDGKSHRIARIGADRSFQGYLEIAPAGESRDVLVKGFAIDDEDNLYVLDIGGSRIVVLDADANLQRSIAFAPEARFISDIAVNATAAVFAIDSVGHRVYVARKGDDSLTPLGESLGDQVDFPTAIAADGAGQLYISDSGGSGIVVLGENGSFQGRHSSRGRSQGFLWQPAGLVTSGDLLFVADRGNNRIQVFLVSR